MKLRFVPGIAILGFSILFIGFFLGLVYPEIEYRNNVVGVECKLIEIEIYTVYQNRSEVLVTDLVSEILENNFKPVLSVECEIGIKEHAYKTYDFSETYAIKSITEWTVNLPDPGSQINLYRGKHPDSLYHDNGWSLRFVIGIVVTSGVSCCIFTSIAISICRCVKNKKIFSESTESIESVQEDI